MLWTARRRAIASISVALRRIPFEPARSLVVHTWGRSEARLWTSLGSGVFEESVYRASYSTTIVKTARICVHDGCSKNASFGMVKWKPIYCKSHKADVMEDVIHRRCAHEGGCRSLNPVFNYPTESKGLYCRKHKLDDMENVVNRKCNHPGCNTQPHYNHPGEKRGLYCGKHKLDNMEDVISHRCKFEGCKTRPVFNILGEEKGLYCGRHRLDGMVDVETRRCSYPGCRAYPSYNYPGEKKGLFCVVHKEDQMLNIVSRRCAYEGCVTFVTGLGVLFCAKHRDSAAAKA